MNFAKLHGAGNDFLLFDGGANPALADELPPLVPGLCHRRFGIGADGVLLVLPTGVAAARVRYWNSDGSEAAFCANGTRCAASFIAARWGWREMVLETGYAAIPAAVDGGQVELRLPAPGEVRPWRELAVAGTVVRGRYLVVGVPHLIVRVEWPDFWRRELAPLAPALRRHPDLRAGGANVSVLQVEDERTLGVRSWERGVEGETLSCGSGDVAAALVAAAEGWVVPPVAVRTASKRVLTVAPEGPPLASPLRLSGPAEWVAEGRVSSDLAAAFRLD
ncbi:MAG TPA: diaminopimelate epimerase [Thermoanaerobaculaceae bacterium]|nr:diaminopimelate epimerase [Thermoanaerobaculaceae bacterium]